MKRKEGRESGVIKEARIHNDDDDALAVVETKDGKSVTFSIMRQGVNG